MLRKIYRRKNSTTNWIVKKKNKNDFLMQSLNAVPNRVINVEMKIFKKKWEMVQ